MDGCKCRECFGLAEYLEAQGLSSRGLPRAPGHKPVSLRVVTLGPDDQAVTEVPCIGGYVCECPVCEQERRDRIAAVKQRRAA